jgi:hypothetical protein
MHQEEMPFCSLNITRKRAKWKRKEYEINDFVSIIIRDMINIDVFSTYRETDQYLLERTFQPLHIFFPRSTSDHGQLRPRVIDDLGRRGGHARQGHK